MAENRTPPSNTLAASGDGDHEYFTSEELKEYFRFKKGRDSASDARNALLVIAVLITTATYQGVLSPPGGLWQETKYGQEAGKSVMATNTIDNGFAIYLAANTIGFFCSIFLIAALMEGFPFNWMLFIILFALIISYDSAMISIIPKGKYSNLFIACATIIPPVIGYAVKKFTENRSASQQRSIQYASARA